MFGLGTVEILILLAILAGIVVAAIVLGIKRK